MTVTAIEKVTDGVKVTFGSNRIETFTINDLPQNVRSGTAQEIEDWINANIPVKLGMYARVKVRSKTPLDFDLVVSQAGPISTTFFDDNGYGGGV